MLQYPSLRGGVCAGGCVAQGRCLPGGGLSAQRGCLPHPPPWTESQMPVKTLPCRNYVTDGKNIYKLNLPLLVWKGNFTAKFYRALSFELLTANTVERNTTTYLLHSMSSFSSYVLEMRMRTTPLASARVMTMKPMIRSGLILIVLPSAVVVFVVFAVLIVVVVSFKMYCL